MNPKKYIYILIALLFTLTGIFLPGYILQRKNTANLGEVLSVSDQYYSGSDSVIAKDASDKLSTYEKNMLVSGVWESEITKASPKESALSEYDAVALAQKNIKALFYEGIYPVTLTSASGDWYSWETTLYKATDTTFHTYSAYLWEIQFTSYEGLEHHTIFMLEDGTILSADAKLAKPRFEDIKPYLVKTYAKYENEPSIIVNRTAIALPYYKEEDLSHLTPQFSYFMVTGDSTVKNHMELKQRYETTPSNEYYYVYQLAGENEYLFCIIPYDGQ